MLNIFSLIGVMLFCLAGQAQAQAFTPSQLEYVYDVSDVLEMTPAYKEYWRGYVIPQPEAKRILATIALNSGCKAEYYDSWYLTPSLRQSIDAFIARTRAQLNDPAVIRYRSRILASAKNTFNAQQWNDLNRLMADKNMLRLYELYYILVNDYNDLRLDQISGKIEVTPVIWLKTYVEKEGIADQFKQALAKIDPRLPGLFDQVKPIDMHRPADDQTVNKLLPFFYKDEDLEKIYETYESLSDPKTVARLKEFYDHPIHDHIRKVKTGEILSQNPQFPAVVAQIKAKPRASWSRDEAAFMAAAELTAQIEREYPRPALISTPKTYEQLVGAELSTSICATLRTAERQ